MIRRILVPLDGSAFGERALARAIELAQRHSASIDLAHVHEVAPLMQLEGTPLFDADLEIGGIQTDRSYLGRALARVSGLGVTATAALLDGPVVSAIDHRADEIGADLIVMATHGRGPLSRAWLGSVADGLARHTSHPVLLIRPPAADSEPDLSAPPAPPRRVLLPVDDAEHTRALLEVALAVAERDASVLVLHVVPGDPARMDEATRRRLADETRASLDGVMDAVRARGHDGRLEVIIARDVATTILDVAARERVDLIGLTTHGQGSLSRLVFGSVTDKVMRAASAPVLVRKPARSS